MTKRSSEQILPRRDCAATVLGGPTTVIDMGGLRIVVDPTFDDPGPHGYLTKTLPPVVDETALGPVDVVLVSHDAHPDNLDDRGRAFASAARLTLTVPSAAPALNARGLEPWSTFTVLRPDGGGDLFFLTVPAVHGPEDGERDSSGFVNCEVTGFVLSGRGLPTVYVSGDNASMRVVGEIARGVPEIDVAVLNAGAARVKGKFRERPVSMDGSRVAATAAVLGVRSVIPAHYDGWTHFTEGRMEVEKAFDEAGLSEVLCVADHGIWTDLRD